MALGVVVGTWVARYLGPLSFGQLSYAIAYIALFQTVASLGLDGIVVRDIARGAGEVGEILGTVFMLRAWAGSACWLIALAVLAFSKGLADPYMLLSAILGINLVFQAADVVDLWFQSQTQSRRTVVAKLYACVASNTLKLFLIHLRAPLYAFAVLLALETAAGAGMLSIVYRRFPAPAPWKYCKHQVSRLLTESWPFIAAGAVNMAQARVEFVMIESFLGAAALGQYAAAARFIEVFDVVFASIAISIYPRISNHEGNRSGSTMRRIYLLAFLTYAGIVPILFLVWLFMGDIYGPKYGTARNLFPFMALRPLLTYVGITKNMAIRINSKSRYALTSSGVGVVVASSTAYLLIPRFGLYGAVFASLSSYLVSNVVIDAVFYRTNFHDIIYCWREWPYFYTLRKNA